MRHLILTGANGYLGARLAAIAAEQGRRVTKLVRQPRTNEIKWSLGEPLPANAILPLREQAMIHLAHDWQGGDINVTGTRTLADSCREAGIRFVFVSSQSARQDAANMYGRLKWQIEQQLDEHQVAARVGLIYGGRPQAMFGLLVRLTGMAPVLPMIEPNRTVQPIHIDEVCHGLLQLADGDDSGWVGLAHPVGMSFGTFLTTLAREFHGRRLRIVPIPLRPALLACDLSAAVPFGPTVDRERVLGLAGTQFMNCASHLRGFNLRLKHLESGLRGEPTSRKALLREAKTLLSFVLRAKPSKISLRRYARAVMAAGEGPLALDQAARLTPRLREPLRGQSPLRQRLALATIIAEASVEGEAALARHGRLGRMVNLTWHVGLEAIALPFRFISR